MPVIPSAVSMAPASSMKVLLLTVTLVVSHWQLSQKSGLRPVGVALAKFPPGVVRHPGPLVGLFRSSGSGSNTFDSACPRPQNRGVCRWGCRAPRRARYSTLSRS